MVQFLENVHVPLELVPAAIVANPMSRRFLVPITPPVAVVVTPRNAAVLLDIAAATPAPRPKQKRFPVARRQHEVWWKQQRLSLRGRQICLHWMLQINEFLYVYFILGLGNQIVSLVRR